MISNDKCKRILGKEFTHLTDEEIEEIKRQLYSLALGLFEIWRKDKLRGKNKKFLKNKKN